MFFSKSKSLIFLILLVLTSCEPEDAEIVPQQPPEVSLGLSLSDSLLGKADSTLAKISENNKHREYVMDSLSKTLSYEEYLIRKLKSQIKEKDSQIDSLNTQNKVLLAQTSSNKISIKNFKDSLEAKFLKFKNLKQKIHFLDNENTILQQDIKFYLDSIKILNDSINNIPIKTSIFRKKK